MLRRYPDGAGTGAVGGNPGWAWPESCWQPKKAREDLAPAALTALRGRLWAGARWATDERFSGWSQVLQPPNGLAFLAALKQARGAVAVWVNEPVTVRVRGLLAPVHGFEAGGQHLARLSLAPRSGRESLELADGTHLHVIGLGGWRREWLLWEGESELAQGRASRPARRAELVYRAVPYFILPDGSWGHGYRLINEADMRVLSITFGGRLRREAVLCPQAPLELALVVFAYDVARRLW